MKSKVIALLYLLHSCLLLVGVHCKLEIAEIQQALDKTLKNLEGKKTLNNDALETMAWGASELECAVVNTPKLPAGRLEMLKGLEKRFMPFVIKAGEKIESVPLKQFMTAPQFWGHEDEYKHRPGRIAAVPAGAKSLDTIVQKSTPTKESDDCIVKLFEDNKLSPTNRACKLACKDKVWDAAKLDNGYPLDERIGYIVFQTLLNCTNDNMDARTKAVITYCNNIMGDINAMDKLVADPKFDNARYYYLNKLLYCGTYGFPEFFTEDRVRGLLKMINADGSVGGKSLKPDDIDTLTSMMADLMAGVLRLLTETGQ